MPKKQFEKSKIIVILGPTSSGKSELAVKIAKKINGEIISADSRQVYKNLNIGSGKVPQDKFPKPYILNSKFYYHKKIRHHLIDVASPKRTFTVSRYQKLAKKTLNDILKRGKIPIICGGTGFYIDALIYDYKLPEIPPQLKLRKKLKKKSCEELFKQLKKIDPRRAQNIDQFNKHRLIRALEIVLTTQKPVPLLSALPRENEQIYNILFIGIKKTQEELKKLITKRLEKRLKQGMIKEIKNIHKSGVSWKKLENFGLEYRRIAEYLQKKINKIQMISLLQKEIKHYAKRQMTWFKKNKKIYWLKNKKEALQLLRQFFLKK